MFSPLRQFTRPGQAGVLGVVALTFLGGCALFQANQRPADAIQVKKTPATVARGSYVANNLAACLHCHTVLTPDTHLPVPEKLGAGGRLFGRADGLPGDIYSTNLTPDAETGLGTWTDGEILRAMREGVSNDGHALFPLMPYPNYHEMSDEDAHATVAYLRTLTPIKNAVPARELDFPLNIIVNTIPKPLGQGVGPAPKEKVARGKYVMTIGSCAECHTPRVKGEADMTKFLAGGHDFSDNGKVFKMPNITQDPETGIGAWTDSQIEGAIRGGVRHDGTAISPVMPYPAYGALSRQDMDALVAYLRTVPAIKSDTGRSQPKR